MELLAWTKTHQKLADNASFSRATAPTVRHGRAMRSSRASSPGQLKRTTGKTALSLRTRRRIKALYEDMLNRAWATPRLEARSCPRRRRRRSPEVPGELMRRLAASGHGGAVSALSLPALAFAHDQPETSQSRWVMADWMMDTFFIFSGLAVLAFVAAGRPGISRSSTGKEACRCSWKKRTTTRPTGRSTKRSGSMRMPSGDTPAKAQAYYHYLNAHQLTMQRPATWEVRWLDLAWLWGFAIALVVVILLWVWQYRSTRQKANIYPVGQLRRLHDGARRPGHGVLPVLTVVLTAFAVVLIVGHIVWGQKF
jgi:hypothetical protein